LSSVVHKMQDCNGSVLNNACVNGVNKLPDDCRIQDPYHTYYVYVRCLAVILTKYTQNVPMVNL
jgi:hypothetical protein